MVIVRHHSPNTHTHTRTHPLSLSLSLSLSLCVCVLPYVRNIEIESQLVVVIRDR